MENAKAISEQCLRTVRVERNVGKLPIAASLPEIILELKPSARVLLHIFNRAHFFREQVFDSGMIHNPEKRLSSRLQRRGS